MRQCRLFIVLAFLLVALQSVAVTIHRSFRTREAGIGFGTGTAGVAYPVDARIDKAIDEARQKEAEKVKAALTGLTPSRRAFAVRSSGQQAAIVKPKEKRAPESEVEYIKKERENRLKMILLSFGGESNTNNITFSDLDLTGWEAEEKKGEEALMLFLEKVWERADAKKVAEKRKIKSN